MPIDYTKRARTTLEPLQGAEPQVGQTPSQVDPQPPAGDGTPRPPVQLRKGAPPVTITKTASLQARASWSSETDYDVYALVVLRDGSAQTVSTFGAEGVPPQESFRGVRHRGDVTGRGDAESASPPPKPKIFAGKASKAAYEQAMTAYRAADARPAVVEVIEIGLDDDVAAVVPVAYSAQSNGTGSFSEYRVTLEVDNGRGEAVRVSSDEANDDDAIYTCVPAVIYHHPHGIEVERVELYSEEGSENRPLVRLVDGRVQVVMDAGPVNDFK